MRRIRMNRIIATLYFVKSAWSFEALVVPLRQGSSACASRQRANSMGVLLGKRNLQHHRRWRSDISLCSRVDSEVDSSSTDAKGCIETSLVKGLLNSEDDFDSINGLVAERSDARWEGDYKGADDLKVKLDDLCATLVPPGYELWLQDIPRKSGGGSRWTLVPTTQLPDEDDTFWTGPKILELSHTAMGLAVYDNQQVQTKQRQKYRQESLERLVETAKNRLEILLEETKSLQQSHTVSLDLVSTKQTMVRTELGGRTASDAALWFALAGSRDETLFRGLADVASWELGRFGQRPSCKPKNIYQILERFAAAGLREHGELEKVAHEALLEKQKQGSEIAALGDPQNYLNLHSDRSLLLIWKFATKQKKQRAFLRSVQKNWEDYIEAGIDNANQTTTDEQLTTSVPAEDDEPLIGSTYNWEDLFEDPSRPLVVDVGCGMGVSLLGLALTTDGDASEHESARLMLGEGSKWSDCNFVGVDLGGLGIEYGRGVAHRWNLEGNNLYLAIDAAEDFCRQLHSYPGEVRCCMIQFPTPFRLENKDGGNSQLPSSKVDGFMVTQKLLETIYSSLDPNRGRLLLQSNCEDVAVWMRTLACQTVGFTSIDDDKGDNPSYTPTPQRIPQRTREWIAMGGERAEGPGWFQREILHRKGATETEVTCAINTTPVHRCLLKIDS